MFSFIAVVFTIISFLLRGQLKLIRMKRMSEEKRALYAQKQVKGAFYRCIRRAHVELDVKGEENIPKGEAVLFIGNHRSLFDVVIGYTLTKGPTGFIAKKELGRWPLLGKWMGEIGCHFLDRKDIKQNLKVILAAIKDVKSGQSIWIYPEGTRSEGEDETEMLPFKDGSFKIAEKSGCKIIPVAMHNTRKVLEEDFPRVHRTRVGVRIGKPIVLSELSEADRKNIANYVRDIIKDALLEMQKEDENRKV